MSKPIIGIVAKPLLNSQLTKSLWTRLVINDEFRELVINNGGIPMGVIPRGYRYNIDTSNQIEILDEEDKEVLFSQLELLDGIILQGGLTADTYEVEIVNYAIKNNIPLIGICAGFNNICRALNLPLKHKKELSGIHDVYDRNYRHGIKINRQHPLCSIFREEVVEVNSLHTMFLEDSELYSKIRVLAWDSDGHIEAFSVEDVKCCLAIKWHPELMLDEHETEALFINYFVYEL